MQIMVTLFLQAPDDESVDEPGLAVHSGSCEELMQRTLAAVHRRWGPPRRLRPRVARHRAHARLVEVTAISVAIQQRLHAIEKLDLIFGREVVGRVAEVLDERCAAAREAADLADEDLARRAP